MFKEHERIVLTKDFPEHGLKSGDVGTVVHVHGGGEAYEVEFLTLDGHTIAVVTVPSMHARSVNNKDVTHARPREVAV